MDDVELGEIASQLDDESWERLSAYLDKLRWRIHVLESMQPPTQGVSLEFGQLALSNNKWEQFDGAWVVEGLFAIDVAVADADGLDPRESDSLFCSYRHGEFTNDVFELRSYCWCDGEEPGHENGCPPNFLHKASGLRVSWYKHAGRGTTVSQPFSSSWTDIVVDCLASVTPPWIPTSCIPDPGTGPAGG